MRIQVDNVGLMGPMGPMTALENSARALERCCCGNQEAMAFLLLWRDYVHRIDDLVDESGELNGRTYAERLLETFALAATLYSHPFYLRHLSALRQLVYTITNAYADSVAMEQSTKDWQQQWADHNRHAGTEMVLAVAQICGGYEHMRSISPELRTVCWVEHHRNGKPC